ncbi:MAG: hypothetical protein E3J72_16915 [Planctomycetota bacterium]|nr:MAG: hypothetical protein E3J72_16915 [Planctomycetota bacterium]
MAKWERNRKGLDSHEISADAVTVDLRTKGDRLSFWLFESADEDYIDEAALALALGDKKDRLDRVHLAWVNRSLFEEDGLELEETRGITKVEDLCNQHIDAIHLDLTRLGKIANQFARAIREHGQSRRLTKNKILQLIKKAIQDGRLLLADLDEKIKDAVQAIM